jgi:RNA polymerase sigma factor for flagellar operon FliA
MKQEDPPDVMHRFESNLDMVTQIARRLGRTSGIGLELEDLVAYGREGLLEAARRFDEERGVPFRAYANFRVRGAVIDGIRTMSRVPRRAHDRLKAAHLASEVSEGAAEDTLGVQNPSGTPAQAEQALSDHLGAMATAMAMGLLSESARDDEGSATPIDAHHSPEEALSQAQLLHSVKEALADLPEDEATLVRRHYLGGERFDHVAAELGLSKSWASRLHTRAIKRLTKRLKG